MAVGPTGSDDLSQVIATKEHLIKYYIGVEEPLSRFDMFQTSPVRLFYTLALV